MRELGAEPAEAAKLAQSVATRAGEVVAQVVQTIAQMDDVTQKNAALVETGNTRRLLALVHAVKR